MKKHMRPFGIKRRGQRDVGPVPLLGKAGSTEINLELLPDGAVRAIRRSTHGTWAISQRQRDEQQTQKAKDHMVWGRTVESR